MRRPVQCSGRRVSVGCCLMWRAQHAAMVSARHVWWAQPGLCSARIVWLATQPAQRSAAQPADSLTTDAVRQPCDVTHTATPPGRWAALSCAGRHCAGASSTAPSAAPCLRHGAPSAGWNPCESSRHHWDASAFGSCCSLCRHCIAHATKSPNASSMMLHACTVAHHYIAKVLAAVPLAQLGSAQPPPAVRSAVQCH